MNDRCPTCGNPDLAAYCSQCGEKRHDPADWKLSELASEVVSELTDLEHSKLWQSLRRLVTTPGQLTAEYWRGKRKPFLGPVKLYLIFFALSLVLYSIHQPTAVYDVRTLAASNPGGNLPRALERRAAVRGVTQEQFAQEFNTRWQSYISMSQLAYPFFVAVALKLLFLRRHLYFTQHLVFSLHVLAFTFLSLSLLWPLYIAFGIKPTGDALLRPVYLLLTAASMVWTSTYLFLALRRTYQERRLPAAMKTVVVFATYFAASVTFLLGTFAVALALTSKPG